HDRDDAEPAEQVHATNAAWGAARCGLPHAGRLRFFLPADGPLQLCESRLLLHQLHEDSE
ncbi:ML2, partial [Symbiodinium sp. CCMP2592]